MIKKLLSISISVSISIFFCFISKADLFDLYDLDQLRTTLPTYIQTIIARYALSSINTNFMLKLRKKPTWKLTTVTKNERPIVHFLEQGFLAPKTPKKIIQSRWEETIYLDKPRNFPHKIIIKYQDKDKPLEYKYLDALSYPEGTIIDLSWLDHDTMNIHTIIGNEVHIWQAYVTVDNKEYTWQEATNLENYVPNNVITLEQILFLMLINSVYNSKGDVDLIYLASLYQDNLGKHLATDSVQTIVDYLHAVLKSFGSIIEPLITYYFTIKNVSLYVTQDYQLLSHVQKPRKHCIAQ